MIATTDPVTCRHGDNANDRQIVRNPIAGGVQFRWQCRLCGSLYGGALPQSPENKAKAVCFDMELLNSADEIRRSSREQRQQVGQSQSAEWWAAYSGYLRSPGWREKRQLVLIRDKKVCQGCMQREATQVHHLTYDHIGDELLFELQSVCTECHDKIHGPKTTLHGLGHAETEIVAWMRGQH